MTFYLKSQYCPRVREEYFSESDLQWASQLEGVLENIKVHWHLYEYTGVSLHL